jgi:hypothetical protein
MTLLEENKGQGLLQGQQQTESVRYLNELNTASSLISINMYRLTLYPPVAGGVCQQWDISDTYFGDER